MSEMAAPDVVNPVDAERAILELSNQIARGVRIITDAESTARARRRDFDVAYALAYTNAAGAIPLRKYSADVATINARADAENAEIAFRHAERRARALERQLMAWQSVNSNIRTIYNAAGVA